MKISSKSVLQIFLNLASKRDSSLHFNRENFILGCTVGSRTIPDERMGFKTLRLRRELNCACPLFKRALI